MASAPSVIRASEALRTLRERFRETSVSTLTLFDDLAHRLAAAPASEEVVAALRHELHRVHGTAGSYGFIDASRLAAKLEQRVAQWEQDPALELNDRSTIIGHFITALKLALAMEVAHPTSVSPRRGMLALELSVLHTRRLRTEAALRGYQLATGRMADLSVEWLREQAPHLVVCAADRVNEVAEVSAKASVPVIALIEGAGQGGDAAARPGNVTVVDAVSELGSLFDVADRLSFRNSWAGATVLVLDDDPSILAIVKFQLDGEGVRIMTCDDPAQLHEQLATAAPSLLLMDVLMGRWSGIDLARELRAVPAYRDLPIVLISADVDPAVRQRAREAGSDDFLLKPIVADELRRRIAQQLERHRMNRLAEGRHPGTGLPLPPRTATDAAACFERALASGKGATVVIARPDGAELTGETAAGWLRETQRIANAVGAGGSFVGYHDGVALLAVLEGDSEIAESVFEALAFGKSEGTPTWRCGIADAASVGVADLPAVLRAAEEAVDVSRHNRDVFVRRWIEAEAHRAPDVIVVEDDAALADMIQYVLREAGVTFRVYDTGPAALAALMEFRTEKDSPLVLLDVDLPGLDGHAIHEQLRQRRPGVYSLVFITANGSEGDQTRALRAGALDYVPKPVSFRVLSGKIALWRERARLNERKPESA